MVRVTFQVAGSPEHLSGDEMEERAMWHGRMLRALGVAMATTLVVAACGGGGDDAASGGGKKELLVGGIEAQSGQYSICAPALTTLKIAIDEINAAGGITAGDATYEVKLATFDDKSDVAQDSTLARQLLKKGAKWIFGPCGAGAASVIQLTQPNKTVVVSSASSAAAAIEPGGDRAYVLTGIPSIPNRVASAVDAVTALEPTRKKMVLIGSDDPTWGAVVQGAKDLWTGDGRTVESVLYPPGTSDLGPYLAKVKSLDPDAVYIGQNPQTVTVALEQLDAAGISKDALIIGHGTTPDLAAKAGGRDYLAVPLSPGPIDGEGAAEASTTLVEKWKKEAGESKLPAYAAPLRYYYDIMYLLKDAMEKSGDPEDTDKVLDHLLGNDTGYEGALGHTSFDKDGFILYQLVSTLVKKDGSTEDYTWKP